MEKQLYINKVSFFGQTFTRTGIKSYKFAVVCKFVDGTYGVRMWSNNKPSAIREVNACVACKENWLSMFGPSVAVEDAKVIDVICELVQ